MKMIELECQNCKATFSVPPSWGDRKHCSKRCYHGFRLRPVEERFWLLVERSEGCWAWKGYLQANGYGAIDVRDETGVWGRMLAHRMAWLIQHGEVPEDRMVCHSCDNRSCVNPAHLFLGTAADNAQDAKRKGRNVHGEVHGMAKLTEAVVAEIKRHLREGVQQKAIARDFGVSPSTVHLISKGKTWRHVE